jgi:tetratricopeptide (TPR) repeat protein
MSENGRDAEAREILARRIAQQADGNPFYLEELVNYVGTEAASAIGTNELSDLALPTSLQGLVLSRLDQLGERPKTLLKVASVVGRVFHASWLSGIYPELGEAAQIREDLQELSRQKFTVFDPTEGEDTYFFRNIITRGVIYDSLLHKMRTALHEQTGQYLESAYTDAEEQFLDLLAYHFEHGINLDKKRYYLRQAGEVAQRTYANEAAVEYFRKVMPLLETSEQIQIMLKVGEVERLVGQWDEAVNMFQEALALAEAAGDKAAVGSSQVAMGEMLRNQGNYTQATIWLEKARAVFEEEQDQKGLAQVLHYSGTVAAQQGDLETAEDLYGRSLALRRELDDQVGITHLLNNLAIIAEYRGDYQESRTLHEEALAIRRDLGDRRMIAFSLSNVGHILSRLGDYPGARTHLEEAVALHREIGDQYSLATTLDNLGNVVRAQASYDEARHLYSESLEINQELGDGWAAAYLLEDIARLLHLVEQNSDALVLLSAAGTLREAIDAPLPPSEQDTLATLQTQIQVELGPAFTRDCVETGKSMSMEQAITFAQAAVAGRATLN